MWDQPITWEQLFKKWDEYKTLRASQYNTDSDYQIFHFSEFMSWLQKGEEGVYSDNFIMPDGKRISYAKRKAMGHSDTPFDQFKKLYEEGRIPELKHEGV